MTKKEQIITLLCSARTMVMLAERLVATASACAPEFTEAKYNFLNHSRFCKLVIERECGSCNYFEDCEIEEIGGRTK